MSQKVHDDHVKFLRTQKGNVICIFKQGKEDLGSYQPAILTLIPQKMEQISFETIFRHTKNEKMIRNSQNRLM